MSGALATIGADLLEMARRTGRASYSFPNGARAWVEEIPAGAGRLRVWLYRKAAQTIKAVAQRNEALDQRDHLKARVAELEAAHNALRERAIRMESSIRWACGEIGDFPPHAPERGLYWWRSELRARSGVSYEPLTRTRDPEDGEKEGEHGDG